MMIKILIVSDKLYPDEAGGSCTYVYETIVKSQKRVKIDVFTTYPDKKENDKLFEGKIYRFFDKKRPIKSAFELLKIVKSNRYEYIIFHSIYSWLIYYMIKIFVQNKPKQIAIFHGPWHKEAKLKYESNNDNIKKNFVVPIMKSITKVYSKDNEKFIFLSEYMKNELSEVNKIIKNKNTIIIPGGVNLENYERKFTKEEAKLKLGIDKNKFVIFTLRRLEYRMGIQNAIKAINLLNDNIKKDIVFVIGGKGNYENQLKKNSEDMKVESIFTGYIPDEEINCYFCAADLFIVPSIELEGFGLVNLESLAMGLPVLATPQGGMKELQGKFKHLYLSNEISAESLSKSINDIKNRIGSEPIREECLEKYSWENISNKLINFIIDDK